jgi:WhiB family redox-sensing transcriptional regulator
VSRLGHRVLSKIVYGDRDRRLAPSNRIRPATAQAILAVTASDIAGGARVHGAATWARIDALVAAGYTRTWIAGQLGRSPSNLRPRPQVTAATRRRGRRTPPPLPPPGPPAPQHRPQNAMTGVDVALIRTPGPGPWVAHGPCRHADPALFFPTRGGDLEAAGPSAPTAPSPDACAEYALPLSQLHGVWGGLSENQRRRVRRRALEAAATAAAPQAKAGALYAALTELAGHSQRWAIVAHFAAPGSATTTASLLRTGRRPLTPRRTLGNRRTPQSAGGSDLWARFTPGQQLATAAGQ